MVDSIKKRGCCTKFSSFVQQPLVIVSSIATSAPSTAYAVPLPRAARGRLGLWYLRESLIK